MKVELGRGERAFWVVLFAAVVAHLAAYALLAYPAMPQTVPTHWGADGAVDGWGDKAGTLVMAAVPLVLALVMLAVPRLDPKGRNFERFRGVYLGMSAALTLFMVAVAWMTPLTALGLVPEGGSLVSTVILFALGALTIARLGRDRPVVAPDSEEDNRYRERNTDGPNEKQSPALHPLPNSNEGDGELDRDGDRREERLSG